MASRDVMDNRIDAWENAYKLLETDWRANDSTTGNYGQVLRGNIRPYDQPVDGPHLPNNLTDEGDINVYEAPNGFGWFAVFDAEEGSDSWIKTISVHEDGPIIQSEWVATVEI